MAVEWIAVGLVIVGSMLGGILNDWSTAPAALALQYLGVVALVALTRGAVAGVVALVTAVGVLAILVAPFDGKLAVPIPKWQTWLRDVARHLHGFDVSVTILAIVGATELMIEHPLGMSKPVGVVVAVLFVGALVQFIVGRPVRQLYALVSLVVGVCLTILEAGNGAVPAEVLLGALLQLVTALAVAYFNMLGTARPAPPGQEGYRIRGLPLGPRGGDGAAP